ncbi:MAG: MMPL family transporter [Clostridiales bacterium]|nr:MMPL family transporter [Clostridiales bacterium]
MKKLADIIVKYKGIILVLFIVLSMASGYMATLVETNFDLFSYVPKDAPSTLAIKTMMDEYEQDIPNAEIAVPHLSVSESIVMKQRIASLPYVREVLWLDDQVDLATPLDLLDPKVVEGFYKDEVALYHVTLEEDSKAIDIVAELQELAGPDGAVRGQVVETANMQRGVTVEISRIVMVAIPVALIILVFATTSWFEPILFMVVIFVGVLLNMGTNIVFDNVSFITMAVGGVLQLAVSMDYAIFLLHRFRDYRHEGMSVEEAMKNAIVKSFSPISSSAITTFFGFLALIFMRFRLGPDLGIVLAKGVIFSLLSVFFLLPVLAVFTYKIIDKTTHKPLLPPFKRLSRSVIRIGIPLMIMAALVIVPAYIGQRSNDFLYGSQSYPTGSREARDVEFMNEHFGENMQMVLLVPKGAWAKEEKLADDLLALPEMKSVIGYVTQVGTGVPPDLLPDRVLSQLISDHYSRLILVAESPAESPETYELAEQIRTMADEVYPDGGTHLAGANFVLLDMKTTINQDLGIVNGLAIAAIALVIMIAFRSLALPILLVLTIELSVWINLAIPYLAGTPLNFIGYLVISTVQLGATVDYGILMAQHYLDHRQFLDRKEATKKTVQTVAGSIIPPALILAAAGFTLYAVSSISVVSELGSVLGRGALTSLVMVLFLLPNLLRLFDRFIEKTTWKIAFVPDRHTYRRTAEKKEIFKMNVKKRKKDESKGWGRSVAGLLVIALFLGVMPAVVQADKSQDLVILPNGNHGKREVVYAKLGVEGGVEQVFVVNHFHPTRATTLIDHGDYESVIQLTGDVTPIVAGSQVTMEDVVGHYYYQGNLRSRELPWLFDISYKLDGKEQTSDQLSGISGKLEMEMAITKNEAIDPLFFDHYALQISIPIDPDRVIIEAATEGFLVSSAGTEHQLNYIVLPGQDTSIQLKMEVSDFAMGQITIAGVLLSFGLDLSEMEEELAPLDELSDGIAEFADGAIRLRSGFRDLRGAFKKITDGGSQLSAGGKELDQGVQELTKGARQLLDEGEQLKSGSKQILDGLTEITDNLPPAELFDSLDLPEFDDEMMEQLDEAVEYLETLSALLSQLKEYEDEIEELKELMGVLVDLIRAIDAPENGELPSSGEIRQYFKNLNIPIPEQLETLLDTYDRLVAIVGTVDRLLELLNVFVDLIDSFLELDMDVDEMIEQVNTLIEQAKQMIELAKVYGPMLSQIGELVNGLREMQKGYVLFHSGLVRYIDEGVGGIVAGLEGTEDQIGLSSGMSDFTSGVSSLKKGLDQYYSSGLVQFSGGIDQLTEGAIIMRDETSGMRELFEEKINEMLDDFANVGFEPVSFVSEKNEDVASVQFVFMTDEIPPVDTK